MSNKSLKSAELESAFTFFNEVGIIGQLSSALFEAELPNGFQLAHFTILNHLVRVGDGKLPSEMARAFQVRRSHMTDLLVKLEKAEYIRFEANPRDGRSKLIYITKSGKEFRSNSIKAFAKPTKLLAKKYDLDRMSKMIPELSALREQLDELRN